MSHSRTTDLNETIDADGPIPSNRPYESPRHSVRIEFAALSDAGKVRSHNEDHFLVTRMGRTFQVVSTNMPEGTLPGLVDEVAYGMVVADGMGGMAAGEKASQLAIQRGVQLVLNSPLWATRADDEAARELMNRLSGFFRQVDTAIVGEGRADRHLSGMGTTLTLAYLIDASPFIVHVGDSRAYRYRLGKLEQLTHDHTMAQGLADLGAIKPEEVHRHSKRHVLTNFVGGPSSGVEPEIHTVQLQDNDTLLLCSDGLTDMVTDERIAQVLERAPTAESAAKALVDQALEAGGRDNITVVLARVAIEA